MYQELTLTNIFQYTLSHDRNQRQQAEKYIYDLSKSDSSFLINLLSAIQQSAQQQQMPMATYLHKYTKQLNDADPSTLIKTVLVLIAALQSQKMSRKTRVFLKGAITTIIMKDKTDNLYKLAVQNLDAKLQQSKQNMTLFKYQFFGTYIHICLCKQGKTPFKVMQMLLLTILRFINEIFDETKNTETQNVYSLEKLNVLKVLFFPLRAIFSFLPFFIGKQENQKLLYEQSLKIILYKTVFNLNYSSNKLISLSTNETDQIITLLKGTAADIFNNCIKILVSIKQSLRQHNTIYLQRYEIIERFRQMLNELFRESTYDVIDLCVDQSISRIITVLVQCGDLPLFLEYYQQHKYNIVKQIIFPILGLNTHSQTAYDQQPEQFFNAQLYLVNRGIVIKNNQQVIDDQQNQFSIPVKAMKLINYFCRHIDGMSTYFVNNCLEGLTQNPNNHIALLILNSLPQKVNGRSDLIQKIKSYTIKQIVKYDQKRSVNQKISYYLKLFLAYRYLQVFSIQNKDFLNQVWGLALRLMTIAKGETLKFLCIQILISTIQQGFSTLLEQKSQMITTLNSLISFSSKQINSISNALIAKVLECLDHVLSSLPSVSMIQAQLISCVKQTSAKLKQLYEIGNFKESLTINLCWNVIKTVIDKTKDSKSFMQNVQVVIIPLYKYLSVPGVCQQDFIYVMQLLINGLGSINKQYQVYFFKMIPTFFSKNKNRFFDLFEIINLYMYYATSLFSSQLEYIESIITMVIKCFESEQITEDQVCEGVLILQNLIYNYQKVLKEQHWSAIIDSTFKILTTYIKHSFLKSNLNIVLALCLISCFERLQKSPIGIRIIQQILSIGLFTESYPQKILIICLCDLLRRIHSPLVQKYYQQIFDSAITLARVAHYYNQINIEEDEQTDQINEEIKGYKMVIERFQSPMKNIDEFGQIKKVLLSIKQNHHEIFIQLVQTLLQEKKIFLKTIMQIEKITDKEHRSILKVKRSE